MNKLQQMLFIDQLKEECINASENADQVLDITTKCDNLKWYDFNQDQLITIVLEYAAELKINIQEYNLKRHKKEDLYE